MLCPFSWDLEQLLDHQYIPWRAQIVISLASCSAGGDCVHCHQACLCASNGSRVLRDDLFGTVLCRWALPLATCTATRPAASTCWRCET